MNDSNLFILLKVIKSNGEIRRLKREGLEYYEIAELTNKIISDNFASYNDDNIVLTLRGERKLKDLETIITKTRKENWIDKEVKSKINKMDKNFIYLPDQNDLDF